MAAVVIIPTLLYLSCRALRFVLRLWKQEEQRHKGKENISLVETVMRSSLPSFATFPWINHNPQVAWQWVIPCNEWLHTYLRAWPDASLMQIFLISKWLPMLCFGEPSKFSICTFLSATKLSQESVPSSVWIPTPIPNDSTSTTALAAGTFVLCPQSHWSAVKVKQQESLWSNVGYFLLSSGLITPPWGGWDL